MGGVESRGCVVGGAVVGVAMSPTFSEFGPNTCCRVPMMMMMQAVLLWPNTN